MSYLEKKGFTSIEAEQALLGLFMINPATITKALFLNEEDFAEPLHSRIFTQIVKGYSEGINHTPMTLARKFDNDGALKDIGGSKYLSNLAKQAIQVMDAKDVANEIRHCAVKRKLHEICEMTAIGLESSDNAESEPEDVLNNLHKQLEGLESGYVEQRIVDSKEISKAVIESFKEEPCYFDTGFTNLNNAMGGGCVRGKAYGIAARKKAGKTAMLSTLAQNMNERGVKTLYVALEMGSEQIMHRIIGRGVQENPVKFVTDGRKKPEFQQKVVEYMRNDRGNLFFLDMPGVDFGRLKTMLTSFVRRKKIECVIIDYWQLVGGKKKNSSTAEHLDEVAQWIAEFSKSENVATITASQINKDGNTRGSEGMRLAFDQVYQMHRCEHLDNGMWMEMMDTRYTPWSNLGDDDHPAFMLEPLGVYFKQLGNN